MPVSLNTDLSSMIIQKSLNTAAKGLNNAIGRMATGYKVNKAADNAAIVSLAKGLEKQIRGSEVAENSIQTGMNILQTAESDLTLIHENVSRIRELALQASSDFYTTDSRNAMAAEAQACYDEVQRLSGGSNFNGINLLDGSNQSMRIQIGDGSSSAENSVVLQGVFDNASASAIGLLTPISTAFASADNAALYLSECDAALSNLAGRLSAAGAAQNRLESAYNSLDVRTQNLYASQSSIIDADMAQESSNYLRNLILQQASASLLVQANQAPGIALNLI